MEVASSVTPNIASTGYASSQANRNNALTSELSVQEKQEIQKLQARDRTVRAHEAAHVAAGGSLVKAGASFQYQVGPDGKRYATGGEVSIDTSTVNGDPQATLRKAQRLRAAALAPAQPSSQDRSVAAKASQMAVQARAEIQKQSKDEISILNKNPFLTETPKTASQFELTV